MWEFFFHLEIVIIIIKCFSYLVLHKIKINISKSNTLSAHVLNLTRQCVRDGHVTAGLLFKERRNGMVDSGGQNHVMYHCAVK